MTAMQFDQNVPPDFSVDSVAKAFGIPASVMRGDQNYSSCRATIEMWRDWYAPQSQPTECTVLIVLPQ